MLYWFQNGFIQVDENDEKPQQQRVSVGFPQTERDPETGKENGAALAAPSISLPHLPHSEAFLDSPSSASLTTSTNLD
jgi:hypothetical protein